jgi:hypothetical protein
MIASFFRKKRLSFGVIFSRKTKRNDYHYQPYFEAKRNIFGNKTKRKYAILIFALEGREKFEAKRSEVFFRMSVRNGSRFALKRNFVFCETGAPYMLPCLHSQFLCLHVSIFPEFREQETELIENGNFSLLQIEKGNGKFPLVCCKRITKVFFSLVANQ